MTLDLTGATSNKKVVLDERKINDGVWVQLYAPTPDEDTGKPVPLCLGGDPDKPQRAKVRSHRCSAIKNLEKERQKSGFVKIRLAKKHQRDGVIAETSILPEEERFSLLLVALDNFGAAGGIQDVKPEDAKKLHDVVALDDVVAQIKEAAYDDELYLASEDTPQGNASSSTSRAQASTSSEAETTLEPQT